MTGRPRDGINTSHLPPWTGEPPSHESFLFFLAPLSVLGLDRGLHGKRGLVARSTNLRGWMNGWRSRSCIGEYLCKS